MTEIIDDLLVLGLAVPEHLKDGRTTVCLGGLSRSKGFIRLYPVKVTMNVHRWDVIRVEGERNERDSRDESWKIAGSKADWDNLHLHVTKVGRIDDVDERRAVLETNTDPCVNTLNEAHQSLGIIRVQDIKKAFFDQNPQYGHPIQLALLDTHAQEWAKVKRDYPTEPRMSYTCSGCQAPHGHNQKVLDWGFFEWMRKNPNTIEQVWENARIHSDQHDIYLFVGNQENQRTSYLIISVLSIRKTTPPPPHVQMPLL